MRTIDRFQVLFHGVENSQYFQGCGVSCMEYDDVATGIGNNPAEAIDDALESLAQQGYETEGMEKRICRDIGKRKLPLRPAVKASEEDCYYYASIRVKGTVAVEGGVS